jgi:nucleotide-binding universal stress UspA family protein
MPKILVCYDGSEHARRALERAASFAGDGDDVAVISVAPMVVGNPRDPSPVDPTDDVAQHRVQADEGVALLRERGVTARPITAVGHVAEAILTAAEREDFELIVVGHRGVSGVQRFLGGSVSRRVVDHAPCDVLVVV